MKTLLAGLTANTGRNRCQLVTFRTCEILRPVTKSWWSLPGCIPLSLTALAGRRPRVLVQGDGVRSCGGPRVLVQGNGTSCRGGPRVLVQGYGTCCRGGPRVLMPCKQVGQNQSGSRAPDLLRHCRLRHSGHARNELSLEPVAGGKTRHQSDKHGECGHNRVDRNFTDRKCFLHVAPPLR